MAKAIYTGTFDPFTNGHLDIVDRARRNFDELVILVARSDRKTALFSVEERVAMIQETIKNKKNVRVDSCEGLVVDYARKVGAQVLVRGLRAASDFEYEFMMAAMNRALNPKVETFFMMTGENLYFVSSSMIKELYRFGGDVSPYLPATVVRYLKKKSFQKKGEGKS